MSTSFKWNHEELYAHPGETLAEHLLTVARRTRSLVKEVNVSVLQGEVAYLAGFCHDLGKATQDFQDYLYCSARGEPWRGRTELKSHSKFGTQIFLVLGEFLLNERGCPELKEQLDIWLAALAIRSHHGRLNDFRPAAFQLIDYKEGGDRGLLTQQIKRLRRPQFDHLLKQSEVKLILQPQLLLDAILDEPSWKRWEETNYYLEQLLRSKGEGQAWAFLKLVYGALLQADKEQNLRGHFPRQIYPAEKVQQYIQGFDSQNAVDLMRSDLFKQCTDYFESTDLSTTRIHKLTLPTGAGKTLCGLQVASLLRQRIEADSGKSSRIIYALPFVSIIEQNFDVFKKVFGTDSGDLLLSHHHLAPLDYKAQGEELDGVEAAFKIEGWESELIVTTFFQLFEALLGTANACNRKLPALQNAIIILDEPQALPIRFFPLIRQTLKIMIQQTGWHIVLMTATPPLLFDPDEPLSRDIVPNFQQVFKTFNRYRIIDRRSDLTRIDDLRMVLEEEFRDGRKRILIVANTVAESRQLHQMASLFCEDKGIPCTYLSTEVLPIHRKEKIESIASDDPVVVVSTQLIEAGVDISLDVVIRDFAPLSSLVQSAGRCCRNDFQECKGRVIIAKLQDDKSRTFAGKVYDQLMLDHTDTILSETEEKTIWPHIEEYYNEIQTAISQDKGKELARALQELRLSVVSKEFSLIDQENNSKRRDVLILCDENAVGIYRHWCELGIKMKDRATEYQERFSIKTERQKLWRQLAGYLITPYMYRIPKDLLLRYPDGLIVIDQNVNMYYDEGQGLTELEQGAKYVAGTNVM